jgi:hypothetical protein
VESAPATAKKNSAGMSAAHMHAAHMPATHVHAIATTTSLRVGCEKSASQRGGYQTNHCLSQHVSPLSLRRVGLGIKLTLWPLRSENSIRLAIKNKRRVC